MPNFAILKNGANDTLLRQTHDKVYTYLRQIFAEHELVKVDQLYSFTFGSVQIEIEVVSWHTEDVLVRIFSYVAEQAQVTKELTEELLRLNATTYFGSFGLTFDGSVVFSHSLAGANLDYNEFIAALQTVATIADDYDEKVKEFRYQEA